MKLAIRKEGSSQLTQDKIDSFQTLFSADVSCGDLVKHNGIIYVVCQSYMDHGLITEIEIIQDRMTTESDDYLVCPVCNYRHGNSWELSDEDDDYHCGRCNAKLSYTSEVTRTFSAKVVEVPKIHEVENGLK